MSIEHTQQNVDLLKNNLFNELDTLFGQNEIIEWNIESFNNLFKSYLNSLLRTEFELFMNDPENQSYRNGYSSRIIKTIYGEIEVKVPRDRDGKFNSDILTRYSSSTEELTKVILQLFQFGLSHNDVCTFINNIYGVKYSRQTVSTMTQVTDQFVDDFNSRELSERYIALFLDATYIPIKFENEIKKQALHLVVAINEFGHQEIIAYSIGFRETNTLWGEVLDDITTRGVCEIDIVVTDGFVGINAVVQSRFPTTMIQRCTVHVLRNILYRVTFEVSPAVKGDFSSLFRNTDHESFNNQLNYLLVKYSKYQDTLNKLFADENITTYLDFPVLMHRTIRTTNRIESINQKIKTRITFKQSFQSRKSFERTLVSSIVQQNNQSDKPVGGLIDYIKRKKR
jgi:transposase-like protein